MRIKKGNPLFLSRLIVSSLIALTVLVLLAWGKMKWEERERLVGSTVSELPEQVLAFISKESSLKEVLEFFKDQTIFLSVNDEASYKMSKDTRAWIKTIGGDELSQLGFRESYVGKIKSGRIVEEKRSKEAVSLEDKKLKVLAESAAKGAGSFGRIRIGKYLYDHASRGLIVFILSNDNQMLCAYSFDFFSTDNPKSSAQSNLIVSKELERLDLVISEKNYNKLKRKRDAAVKANILLTGDDDLVKAKLLFRDKKYKTDIRLKGDWVDHLQGDNWSFRVKLAEGETLKGMRKFSLHRPAARNYAGEWLFHQLLKEEDILHLQYDFVEVVLTVEGELSNMKKKLGIYAMEEFFEKQLIERNKRREGVIVKIDESFIWEQRARYIKDKFPMDLIPRRGWLDNEIFPVIPFSQGRILEDSTLLKQFLTAQTLMRGYIRDSLKISQVFDVKRLAKFNAICNLLGANHALISHNQRFYYNPVNSRLEPIGFDGNAFTEDAYFQTYAHALNDTSYMRHYVEALEEVSSDDYIQRILQWDGLQEMVTLMEKSFPEYKWNAGALTFNQKAIQTFIHPVKTMNVYVEAIDQNVIQLSIDNFGKIPIEILGLKHENNRLVGQVSDRLIVNPNDRQIATIALEKNFDRLFVNKKKRKSGFDPSQDIEKLKLIYKPLGTNKEKTESLIPWGINNRDIAENDLFRKRSTINNFDFLIVDEQQKTITCKPGIWKIDRWMIIPKGYTFYVSPGTQLQFVTIAAKIISFSPVRLLGTKEKPIEIKSLYGLGHGFAVLNCQDTSVLQYCKFDNLTNPQTKGWALTGAVNFYEAPVIIKNTEFTNNRCEDGLNIFRGWFEMDQVYFSNTQSDAFDGDFVTGKISNTIFDHCGNDAIDISGSTLTVENVSISFAGDKGLSAGENSQMTAINIIIEDSEVALASKDKSLLKIKNAILRRNKLGMTAFQKKMEFGPAQIIADSIRLEKNLDIHLIENRSSCRLNGTLTPTIEKVKEQMYGVKYGKSSK